MSRAEHTRVGRNPSATSREAADDRIALAKEASAHDRLLLPSLVPCASEWGLRGDARFRGGAALLGARSRRLVGLSGRDRLGGCRPVAAHHVADRGQIGRAAGRGGEDPERCRGSRRVRTRRGWRSRGLASTLPGFSNPWTWPRRMQKALVVVAERLERGVARARVAHLLRARREAVPLAGRGRPRAGGPNVATPLALPT
jgi:hypothetical protein